MKRFLFAAIFIVASGLLAVAQPIASKPAASLPFVVGEKLQFEGKIIKLISVTIGDLILEVAEPEGDRINLKIDAASRGTMLKLFRYSFKQQITTLADADELHAFSSFKHDVQKQKVRDSKTTFDYERQLVTWVETNPNAPTEPPRTIASDLNGNTFDIVSALYYLRTLPLALGYSTTVNVSDSGLVYRIPLKVAARERQKTIFGQVWCLRVEPELFGPNRFFEQKGKMEIWVTDDARRIPVRARVNAEVGKVDIRLKDAQNLK